MVPGVFHSAVDRPQRSFSVPPERALQDLGGFSVVVLGEDQDNLEDKKDRNTVKHLGLEERRHYQSGHFCNHAHFPLS